MSGNALLILQEAKAHDSGTYICAVHLPYLLVKVSVELEVIGEDLSSDDVIELEVVGEDLSSDDFIELEVVGEDLSSDDDDIEQGVVGEDEGDYIF